jgi:hypothetical protein
VEHKRLDQSFLLDPVRQTGDLLLAAQEIPLIFADPLDLAERDLYDQPLQGGFVTAGRRLHTLSKGIAKSTRALR